MSVLENVLREEKNRIESNINAYNHLLSKLPKGSIFVRKNNNSYFVYKKYRVDKKVVSEYIGPINSNLSQKAIDDYQELKRIKMNLRIAKAEYKKLSKAMKVYER